MRLNPTPSPTPSSHAPAAASTGSPSLSAEVSRVPDAPRTIANPVLIDIYRSTTDRSKYLSVPGGTDLANMAFPADMDADLFTVSPYKDGVEIQAGRAAMGLDVEDILGQLGRQGFALHGLKFAAALSMGVGLGRED